MNSIGLLDRFFKKQNQDLERIVDHSLRAAFKGLSPGRQVTTKWEDQFFKYDGVVNRNELRTKDVMKKLEVIRDLNPDASMALWNILRLANNGHTLEAITTNGKVHKGATNELNELAKRVGVYYGGGTDQLINVLLVTAFTQGAIALEVELNEGLTDVVDFHAIDPFSLHYRRDKETGEMELVQILDNGDYKVLNREQVFYYPIDPSLGDPYGRSPILPALQVVMFQAGVLKDLKKVLHHQGHERFDISVVEESIIENMPDQVKSSGPQAIQEYVNSYIADVQSQMADLEPDDDFFHTDSINIDTAGGSQRATMDAQRVIDIINQQMVTSLKQLPILLGRNEGTTETHGTVQWQIYVGGIESIQRSVKRVLEKAYNVVLQIKGRPLRARVTFNAIEKTDRLKDAQAEKAETDNKIAQVKQGWISNDEAAMDIVGHEAVDEPQQQQGSQSGILRSHSRREGSEIKKRLIDDRDDSLEINQVWANDIEDLSERAESDYVDFLQGQMDEYINRLEDADEIPTRVLADIVSLKRVEREEKPDPPPDFEEWVRVNILYDSEAQVDKMEQMTMTWINEAALIAGTETLAELSTEIEFDPEDTNMIRWLSDRSRRSAELIQGVSDERVLMSLWDVVYEGSYSIGKASEALQDEYAFDPTRANTIARTEIITAGRAGQYHADGQSGMVIGKVWRSALQERTREHHREADGQRVPFDEPFIVKGEPLMFPGDSSMGASADNTIQCRCFYTRILEGEEI
ncbi:phage minor head protein [Halobacillus sp. H74]|uniref:phage minor head protein n=1 Tax=Halobacillus sp. H74 TaxID=3457436 RepID=UPI003FCC9F81